MSDSELKDLMDDAVRPLSDMPDAVPAVLVAGRASVRRRRATVTAAAAVAGVLAVVGAVALAGSERSEPPVLGGPSVRPTFFGPSAPLSTYTAPPTPGTPEFRAFKNRMARALTAALPDGLGTVRPASATLGYTLESSNGRFAITFRLDDAGMIEPGRCPVNGRPADVAAVTKSCLEQRLPKTGLAVAWHELGTDGRHQSALPRVETVIDRHWLQLYFFQDAAGKVPAITDRQLIDVLKDPALGGMVQEWLAHPEWQVG